MYFDSCWMPGARLSCTNLNYRFPAHGRLSLKLGAVPLVSVGCPLGAGKRAEMLIFQWIPGLTAAARRAIPLLNSLQVKLFARQ